MGVRLAAEGAAALSGYLDAMLAENAHINLTAIRDPGQARVLHALDSLAIGKLGLDEPGRVFDLGTGNGFPGVAVHALWPAAEVVLCDRTQKKAEAIKRILAAAGWPARVQALGVDAAQIPGLQPDWRGVFDVATARAVGEPAAIAAMARPLLGPGGLLVLWLDADAELPETGKGAPRGFKSLGATRYELPEPARRVRQLWVLRRSSS